MTVDRDLLIEVYIDDALSEEVVMPTLSMTRRHDIAWKFNMENGNHNVKIQLKNPVKGYRVEVNKVIIYGPEPEV